MIFILFFIVGIFALSRLFTSVWLQIWLDHGDGNERLRHENATLYNLTLRYTTNNDC